MTAIDPKAFEAARRAELDASGRDTWKDDELEAAIQAYLSHPDSGWVPRATYDKLHLNWREAENALDEALALAKEARAQVAALREAIEWAIERLEIDGGMTAKEQRTTEIRLRHILTLTDTAAPEPAHD